MTIVVYDGKKMIADSLAVAGDMKLPGAIPKIYFPEGDDYWEINGTKVLAFGLSGCYSALPYIKELLQKGVTHRTIIKPEYDISFEIICVLETGDAYVLSTEPTRVKGPGAHDFIFLPYAPPIAVGSGAPYAMAVMSPKDKNQAEKGIEAAKRMCPYCGGDSVVWELPPPPAVPSKRPVLTVSEILGKEDSYPINGFNVGQLKEVVGEIVNGLIKKADEPPKEQNNG